MAQLTDSAAATRPQNSCSKRRMESFRFPLPLWNSKICLLKINCQWPSNVTKWLDTYTSPASALIRVLKDVCVWLSYNLTHVSLGVLHRVSGPRKAWWERDLSPPLTGTVFHHFGHQSLNVNPTSRNCLIRLTDCRSDILRAFWMAATFEPTAWTGNWTFWHWFGAKADTCCSQNMHENTTFHALNSMMQ